MRASSQPLQETVFGLLRVIKGIMREAIRAEGLTLSPIHFLMMKYVEQMADCTALRLAEATQTDKAQVTRLLKDLTSQGLLERLENPGDRRSSLLSLSAELGQRILANSSAP